MRHAWKANDAVRDEGLTYPDRVVQIKNLDYKKELDVGRYRELMTSWVAAFGDSCVKENEGESVAGSSVSVAETVLKDIIIYAADGGASDIDSDLYPSNSLFDLCVPASYMTDAGRKYPVIVNVHGGGWFYGDKELYSHYCCHLAERGYVVVNFNYRLSPQNKYPAAIEDVAYLVRYIHDNAETFGIDMDSFYMVGDSAGAQLTENYCIIASNEEYRNKLDFFTYTLLPKKVCLNCGAYKLADRNDQIASWYIRNSESALAVTQEQYELFMDQLSYINTDFPEAYLMYSVNDDLGYHTVELDKVMNEVGVKHVTRAYGQDNPESGHVFHVNMRNPEGIKCNKDECRFMR